MRIQIINLLFTLLFVGAFGKRARILNGATVDIRNLPFIVSIRFNPTNVHLCGGVIISNKHILTVAHCVYDFMDDWSNLKVFAGSSTLSATEGTAYPVQRIIYHPRYNARDVDVTRYRFDLAVLIVQGGIQFNEIRRAASLPTGDITPGRDAVIAGWGLQTPYKGTYSYNLRQATVKVVTYDYCKKNFPFPVYSEEFCTFLNHVGVGEGDDGGPVFSNGVVIGIMTYRSSSESEVCDIHSNLFRQMDFLRSALRQ